MQVSEAHANTAGLTVLRPSEEDMRRLANKPSPPIGPINDCFEKSELHVVPDFDPEEYYYADGKLVEMNYRYGFEANGLDESSSLSDLLDEAMKKYNEIQGSGSSDKAKALKIKGLDESLRSAVERFAIERNILAIQKAYPPASRKDGKPSPEESAAWEELDNNGKDNAKKLASAFLDVFKMQQLLNDAAMANQLNGEPSQQSRVNFLDKLNQLDDFLRTMDPTGLGRAVTMTAGVSQEARKSMGEDLERVWQQMKRDSAISSPGVYDRSGRIVRL